MTPYRFVAAPVLAALPFAAVAQTPPAPTLRASVDQVVVDVVVTDAAGRPVTGLTAADFQVRERRQLQVLGTVIEVSAAPRNPGIASAAAAADAIAAERGSRYYVLLLDDYHVALPRTADVRAAAHAFVDRYAAPGDRIGILTSSRLGASVVDPTADRAAVHATIDRFVGRGGAPLSRVPTSSRRGDSGRNADRMASNRTSALSTYDPRGLSHIDPNALGGSGDQLGARVGQATRDRLQAAHMLNQLAERSGGLAFVDRNDSRVALERVVGDSRHHYLLGYVPADASRRGRFRSIDVRVTRPGVTVRARQGYVEPKDRR